MKPHKLEKGDLLQINPEYERYGGQILMVTEQKRWGAQGVLFTDREYVGLTRYKGRAFLRVKFQDVIYIGRIEYIFEDKGNDE